MDPEPESRYRKYFVVNKDDLGTSRKAVGARDFISEIKRGSKLGFCVPESTLSSLKNEEACQLLNSIKIEVRKGSPTLYVSWIHSGTNYNEMRLDEEAMKEAIDTACWEAPGAEADSSTVLHDLESHHLGPEDPCWRAITGATAGASLDPSSAMSGATPRGRRKSFVDRWREL